MQDLTDHIKSLSTSYFTEVKEIRRHIHQNPELSFQEEKTAAFVTKKLDEIGIEYKDKVAGTGIIATIRGKQGWGNETICLRADLDALPIAEQNDVSYKSKNEGIMHACGHDVHTASLLGAAKILHELRNDFPGNIRLIFQPGEEKLPGGASLLIKEGALQNPVPFAIIGQHVMPEMQVGNVGFRPGLYMASTDEIYITVKGKGGHGAMPHTLIDPVLISAQLIIALQQVVSRWCKPSLPSVLSFGKIIGNGATNVVPDEVKIEGTFRTFNEEWRSIAHTKMKELAKGLVEGMGGKVDFDIQIGYPFLKNDEELTNSLILHATEYMGSGNVEELELRTTAEDFSFYTHHVPGCFYRLGTGNKEKGITASVHNPHFDIDEEALKTGMGLMAYLAIKKLIA
jgi:amidohydrolase